MFTFSFSCYFLLNTWFHLRLSVVVTLCSASCLPSCPPYVTWTCQKCSCSCSQVRAGTLVQTLVTERPLWRVQNTYCTNHPLQMFPSLTDVNGNYSFNIPKAVDFIRHATQYNAMRCELSRSRLGQFCCQLSCKSQSQKSLAVKWWHSTIKHSNNLQYSVSCPYPHRKRKRAPCVIQLSLSHKKHGPAIISSMTYTVHT